MGRPVRQPAATGHRAAAPACQASWHQAAKAIARGRSFERWCALSVHRCSAQCSGAASALLLLRYERSALAQAPSHRVDSAPLLKPCAAHNPCLYRRCCEDLRNAAASLCSQLVSIGWLDEGASFEQGCIWGTAGCTWPIALCFGGPCAAVAAGRLVCRGLRLARGCTSGQLAPQQRCNSPAKPLLLALGLALVVLRLLRALVFFAQQDAAARTWQFVRVAACTHGAHAHACCAHAYTHACTACQLQLVRRAAQAHAAHARARLTTRAPRCGCLAPWAG